jgi:DNA-binding IclR family transcriptional regulator
MLQTLLRASEVLELFRPERPELALSDIVRETGLSKTVAHRICATLTRVRLLHQDHRTRRYRCGTRLLELAETVLSGLSLRSIAMPFMTEVLEATGESVFLNIVSDMQSVCIEALHSPQVLKLTYGVGRHTPLYAGAPARLLLAFLPEQEQERVLALPFASFTPATVTDPSRLRSMLDTIRREGWAWSIGEFTPHVGAVSVPVRCAGGEVVAALSVAGVETRYEAQSREAYRSALAAAAGRLGEVIRHLDRRALLGM